MCAATLAELRDGAASEAFRQMVKRRVDESPLSQLHIAEELEIGESHLSRLLLGQTHLNLDMGAQILWAVGLQPIIGAIPLRGPEPPTEGLVIGGKKGSRAEIPKEWLCPDYAGPCTCTDPETHDGAAEPENRKEDGD